MDTLDQIKPIRTYNRLAIVSFVVGLIAMVFPTVSVAYLIAVHGGPGYLQSLFCGIPVALVSIVTGTASLVQIGGKNQKGGWMAVLGIAFGGAFFIASCILVLILISPYLFYGD
jgi:ABC-type sulfate transport system permease component